MRNNGLEAAGVDTSRIRLPGHVENEVLTAGGSNTLGLLPKVPNQIVSLDHRALRRMEGNTETTIKISDPRPAGEPVRDKKRNWAAIAGLAIVVIGIAGYAIPLWPLVPVGIVLSIIGLKSEKRGWALAGLIIGLAAIAAVLIYGLVYGFYRQITIP
jgi:hypothetical protein